jgi:ribonuclease P protein component
MQGEGRADQSSQYKSMLDKGRRVPRELFKEVFEEKKHGLEHAHSINFSLISKNVVEARARVGVSVSKKVSKSAVVRNKIRRRAYSALRHSIDKTRGGIYLLSAKKGAEKLKFEALKTEIEKIFSKFVL